MTDNELLMQTLVKILESGGVSALLVVLGFLLLRPRIAKILDVVLGLSNREEDYRQELPNILTNSMILNNNINELLNGLLRDLQASRIYIFTYHNGGHSISGISFMKASCTHEIVSVGIKPQQMLLQNLPITMFSVFNRMVLNKEGLRCHNIECFIESDPSTFETLNMQGIKSLYCVGLYSQCGTPIGFLGVDYCNELIDLSDDKFAELTALGIRVSSLMCLTVSSNPLCACTTPGELR